MSYQDSYLFHLNKYSLNCKHIYLQNSQVMRSECKQSPSSSTWRISVQNNAYYLSFLNKLLYKYQQMIAAALIIGLHMESSCKRTQFGTQCYHDRSLARASWYWRWVKTRSPLARIRSAQAAVLRSRDPMATGLPHWDILKFLKCDCLHSILNSGNFDGACSSDNAGVSKGGSF